ncbi:hypothetical protein B0H21DRAFT_777223 [Amylocystis lapponica]|nr:hypothetical protein B0H21DRAFT_777223 [Amylocystis lapponica]
MATLTRNPLTTRPYAYTQPTAISPFQMTAKKSSSAKRARSPDPGHDHNLSQSAKRFKPVAASPAPTASRAESKKVKDRKRAEDENPDVAVLRNTLEKRVSQMGARVEDFFSKDITHLITLHDEESNKENHSQSPIRLKGRPANEVPPTASNLLVKKATTFNMKIWSASKLANVLDRCNPPGPRPVLAVVGPAPNVVASTSRYRPLAHLLESERLHGTTERDPTQRRHGYVYFPKASYFVLVEDMRQELATIAATAYPITRGRDLKEKARGPFLEYDAREERRREKMDRAEQEREQENAQRKARMREEERRQRKTRARIQAQQHALHDLRRTASMNNLRRRATYPEADLGRFVDLDADGEDTMESANASGYLASGAYMAASGNSVGITSTTGTTSALATAVRSLELPSSLRDRLHQQVVTSRKFGAADDKENRMPPPQVVPERRPFLRKSRSTNTLKLPKREEGVKPGYCESCRVKFEDFKEHCNSRKHLKFATDDSNFIYLDAILSRVKRQTLAEVAAENRAFEEGVDIVPAAGDDVHWDEWVDEEL